jgi:hypothetical protein
LDIAAELGECVLDFVACDVFPWRSAYALPLAVIRICLAPEQTRRAIFLEEKSLD